MQETPLKSAMSCLLLLFLGVKSKRHCELGVERSKDDSDLPGTKAVSSAAAASKSTMSAQLVPDCALDSLEMRLSQLETPLANFWLRPW